MFIWSVSIFASFWNMYGHVLYGPLCIWLGTVGPVESGTMDLPTLPWTSRSLSPKLVDNNSDLGSIFFFQNHRSGWVRPVGTTTASVRPIGEKKLSKRIFSVESPCFYLFTVFPVLYLKWYIVKFSVPAIFHCLIRPRRSRATHPSVFNLLWQKISCSESGLMLWVISWSSDYMPQYFSSLFL